MPFSVSLSPFFIRAVSYSLMNSMKMVAMRFNIIHVNDKELGTKDRALGNSKPNVFNFQGKRFCKSKLTYVVQIGFN